MNPLRFLSGLVLLAAMLAPLRGQTPPADDNSAPTPPGATVITSDELQMDKIGRTAIFTGNVEVVGNNFNMKCEEMTVYFTADSKVDNIIAKGNVVIVQPGRVTHCGQAQYFRDQDKFVLTDQPDILSDQNEISAPTIIIHRNSQQLETIGRTKTRINDKNGELNGGSSTNSAPGTPK